MCSTLLRLCMLKNFAGGCRGGGEMEVSLVFNLGRKRLAISSRSGFRRSMVVFSFLSRSKEILSLRSEIEYEA